MDTRSHNTKNRKLILDFLEQNQMTMVTAQDILAYLNQNAVTVNRSTIYRYINQLCEENLVMKYVDNKEGKTVFQYVGDRHDCCSHIHLKCVKCNRIEHLECGFMEKLREHLSEGHHFNLQCEGSVLYGICDRCMGK